MTTLVLGVLLSVSVLSLALLALRLRARERVLRRTAQAERAAQQAAFDAELARQREQWQTERAGLVGTVGESGNSLELARAAQRSAEARAGQAVAEQADTQKELAAVRAARADAEAKVRLLEARLRETDDAVPPTARAASPAVPRELPLGRDAAADSVVDGADLGPVVVRAASVRGRRHREDREHRRDAVQLRLVDGSGSPVLLSAVAPGAPHAPLSQSAATAACRALVTQLSSGTSPFRDGPFGEGDDASVTSALRTVLAGVANSVRLVGRANTAGVVHASEDAQVATSLYGLLSQLGDHRERQHLVFGVGDARLLRLRAGDGAEGAPRWTPLLTPDAALAGRSLPAVAEDGSDLVWQRVVTRSGDVLLLASGAMARLLDQEEVADWYARRWHGRHPFLTSFLSDVNADIRDDGGDRSLVCLWDHGHAAALRGEGAAPRS
ncbi:protein phosphatase 2C domain-containing protein [Streptomyces indiaensis]|uniref:PPM-type phosphatase domain-containing protein n=1 Tax=Streptomyces indiaensis TaxID=284033 RepID=A0ABN3EJZ9_9ACTN|nr:protein phosphatase 2C domain-containing protein [Streptomyces indiaensis]MCF1648622.1 protein phosphatase 2C domain-containing protein [Streptomyces indiaensis]